MKRRLLPFAFTVPLVLAACSRGDGVAEDAPEQLGDDFTSSHFLQFFNKQPSLAAGDYTLVIAPAAAGQSGSYSLSVTYDDGRSARFGGTWTDTASADPNDADNPNHAATLLLPGGLVAQASSSAAACLYLIDRAGNVLDRAGDSNQADAACDTGATTHRIDLPTSHTDATRYAQAFYATIDPCNERESVDAWKSKNGFDAGEDVHVIFRDTKDLGYGRDMHFRKNADGSLAFFVRNFQIDNLPGQSYGPLNLDAAISDVRKYHIGTNAIEWGPVYEDADGDGACDDAVDTSGDGTITQLDYFVRHYTFDPAPVQARRLVVDLDNKGPKAMPVPCILCHGGRADPLLPDGTFARNGDTKARLQPFDVGSFEYSSNSGYTRAELESLLKQMNQAIYETYALYDSRQGAGFPPTGEWDSSMARAMVEDWYGGLNAGQLKNPSFNDDHLPDGWVPNPSTGTPPAGADLLYRDVIADNCRTCHLLRGVDHQNDIDFSSYEKFIGHADQLEEFVFDRGIMPLAFVTFDNFWDSSTLPELLASFLPGFSRYNADGSLMQPGRPIAKAGPDRSSPSPVTVNASASLFATAYEWSIVSKPGGATASLDDATSVRTELVADTDGAYVLALRVSDGSTLSAADNVTLTIDSTLAPAPRDITFVDHIKPILQSDCTACHDPAVGSPRPPVFYTDPAPGENRDLYEEVRARVDLLDPENSRLLRKPTDHHHNGGLRSGFDLQGAINGDRSRYDLFLNWILEGAREQ